MAMDLRDPNVWISHLLENLPEEKLASALKDDNPNWEYIDGEIVKLGSLAHSQLDIPELQRRGLVILASESKDFRLLAHLLRTLQHAGDPHLALRLLALYVEHYWSVAAPQNMAHKKRFASQVIKRFETGIEGFSQNAATAQRDALSGELAKLRQQRNGRFDGDHKAGRDGGDQCHQSDGGEQYSHCQHQQQQPEPGCDVYCGCQDGEDR